MDTETKVENKLTTESRLRLFTSEKALWNTDDITSTLLSKGFFTAPASTKYHGSHEGGLFDHSWKTMDNLVLLTWRNGLIWQRPESPRIVGMYHDLCKMDSYKFTPEVIDEASGKITAEARWEWNNDTLLKGHGDKSVMLLATLMQLTEEEVMCIKYHMGTFVPREEWNDYTRAVKKYPNVVWTHHADMLAAHVETV